MNNTKNKYYLYEIKLHHLKWLEDSTEFSKTYIKFTMTPGLKLNPVGLNITKENENKYVTAISGTLRRDNTVFELHNTNILQSISIYEYNNNKSKISKCMLDEFIYENLNFCNYKYGLWWDSLKVYRIPNLIFDTVMNNEKTISHKGIQNNKLCSDYCKVIR